MLHIACTEVVTSWSGFPQLYLEGPSKNVPSLCLSVFGNKSHNVLNAVTSMTIVIRSYLCERHVQINKVKNKILEVKKTSPLRQCV